MTNQQIIENFEPCELTDNVWESIVILSDGTMLNGEFDCGIRGNDHDMFLSLFEDSNVENILNATGAVLMVPETQTYIIANGQTLTDVQKDLIAETGYVLEN